MVTGMGWIHKVRDMRMDESYQGIISRARAVPDNLDWQRCIMDGLDYSAP